jgi:hypothetical protein
MNVRADYLPDDLDTDRDLQDAECQVDPVEMARELRAYRAASPQYRDEVLGRVCKVCGYRLHTPGCPEQEDDE